MTNNRQTFVFTTLAIGQRYYDMAMAFSEKLWNVDQSIYRIIVSDIKSSGSPPNTLVLEPEADTQTIVCNAFNYNLKYQAIKFAMPYNTDYIIYTDADWVLSDKYATKKINKFLQENNSAVDFFFERPHSIGASKLDWNNCFWRNKIHPYNLLETTKYDHADVCNEQFLIFKNNHKLNTFVDAWSEKNRFCIANNVWTFAEGVEIGMSAVDAEMLTQWSAFYTISHCFEFHDVQGKLHIRF